MDDNTEKEQEPRSELPNPVDEWVKWYIETCIRHNRSSLVGLFQAYQKGRLVGGEDAFRQGLQRTVDQSGVMFDVGPSSAYARVVLEHVGCPREETAVVEGESRAKLMQALFKHLTDHALELTDCTASLPPSALIPTPPPA